MERYRNIIKGQFYGHTHEDSFELLTSVKNGKDIVSYGFINPTLGTYSNNNPSFKIYYIDQETYEVLDHETYRLYINKANEQDKPEWKFVYRFSDYYGYTNPDLPSYADLSKRLITDKKLTSDFVKMLKTETAGWEHTLNNLGMRSC